LGKTEVSDDCQTEFTLTELGIDGGLAPEIRTKTIAATNAYVTLKNVAADFNNIFKHKYNPLKRVIPVVDKFEQIYSEQGTAALNAVVCPLKKCVEAVSNNAKMKRLANRNPLGKLPQSRKKLKRAVAAKVLEASMGQRAVFWNFTLKKANDAPAVDAAIEDSAEWIKYVNGLDIYVADSIGQNFVAGLIDGVTSAMSSSLSYERDVWQPGTKGEILMSNSSEKTLRFNGTTIVSDDNLYVDQADKKKVVARIRQLMLSFA
jgi:hypothetical protein